MTNLTRWNTPHWGTFKDFEGLGEHFGRLFGRFPTAHDGNREALTVADWTPTVDISEDEKEFLIKAEVPEVDRKDVKVTVEDGVLTLMGERRKETEEKGKKFHRVERAFGTFARSFTLPEDVAEDKVRAEFKEGLLLVHLPKTEKARPKAIDIAVN